MTTIPTYSSFVHPSSPINEIAPWDQEESSYSGEEEESEYNDDSYDYYNRSQYGYEKVFRIALNASFLGKFYLPAVKCEAMYDHSISATVPGRWVQVVKSKTKSF